MICLVNGESKKNNFVRLCKRSIDYGKIYLGVISFGNKKVRFLYSVQSPFFSILSLFYIIFQLLCLTMGEGF